MIFDIFNIYRTFFVVITFTERVFFGHSEGGKVKGVKNAFTLFHANSHRIDHTLQKTNDYFIYAFVSKNRKLKAIFFREWNHDQLSFN